MKNFKNNLKKKSTRSKNWLKIWEKIGYDSQNFKIEKILNTNGFISALGKSYKQNWIRYIKNLLSKIKIKKNSEILEYGCGAGAFLSYFYHKKYNLNGIDYSKKLIKEGKRSFPKINFKFGETSKIDSFNKKFDLIISHSVFHYFNDYKYTKTLINKMISKLKDNGYICILDVPDKDKEQKIKKQLINKIGSKKYKKKYGVHTHLLYKKSFFRDFAKKNDLKVKIFNQSFKYYENYKSRYNIIFQKKSN